MKLISTILLATFLFSFQSSAQPSRTETIIMELSKEKNTYMNASSVDKLLPLLDDRMVFIHSNGMTESKDEMAKNLKDGKWNIEKVSLKGQPSVRIFKNDTAILIGKGTFYVNSEGKKIEVDLYFTEVYTHYKKGWKLISRHANKIQ